jgi:hypothetical protein
LENDPSPLDLNFSVEGDEVSELRQIAFSLLISCSLALQKLFH